MNPEQMPGADITPEIKSVLDELIDQVKAQFGEDEHYINRAKVLFMQGEKDEESSDRIIKALLEEKKSGKELTDKYEVDPSSSIVTKKAA